MEITTPMDYVRLMLGTIAVENALLRQQLDELSKSQKVPAPPSTEKNDNA